MFNDPLMQIILFLFNFVSSVEGPCASRFIKFNNPQEDSETSEDCRSVRRRRDASYPETHPDLDPDTLDPDPDHPDPDLEPPGQDPDPR